MRSGIAPRRNASMIASVPTAPGEPGGQVLGQGPVRLRQVVQEEAPVDRVGQPLLPDAGHEGLGGEVEQGGLLYNETTGDL